MKRMIYLLIVFSLVIGVGLTGCSKKTDINKPVTDIEGEVQNMNLSQLQSNAQAYAKEIQSKQGDVEQVLSKVKELSPKDLLSDAAKNLKQEASQIKSDISALTQRYNIYAKKFKELGGDVAQISI